MVRAFVSWPHGSDESHRLFGKMRWRDKVDLRIIGPYKAVAAAETREDILEFAKPPEWCKGIEFYKVEWIEEEENG